MGSRIHGETHGKSQVPLPRSDPRRRQCLACALLALPAAARAQELAPPTAGASSGGAAPAASGAAFGSAGQWALTVRSLNAGNSASSFFFDKQAGGPWTVTLQPALDYFIAGGVSVGGVVGFSYASGGITTVAVGARAGFNQALNEHFGFWPTIGVDASFQHSTGVTTTLVPLEIFAPFLYHPAPHLFLGAGPVPRVPHQGGPGHPLRPRLRHRRLALSRGARPEARAATSALRTASASALRVPTSTQSRLPRVTAV